MGWTKRELKDMKDRLVFNRRVEHKAFFYWVDETVRWDPDSPDEPPTKLPQGYKWGYGARIWPWPLSILQWLANRATNQMYWYGWMPMWENPVTLKPGESLELCIPAKYVEEQGTQKERGRDAAAEKHRSS